MIRNILWTFVSSVSVEGTLTGEHDGLSDRQGLLYHCIVLHYRGLLYLVLDYNMDIYTVQLKCSHDTGTWADDPCLVVYDSAYTHNK